MGEMCKILVHCVYHAFRHPFTRIEGANPMPYTMSPIPWWGSIGVLLIGVVTWCLAARWGITGLDEAARAMVYTPLGNIFGMSTVLAAQSRKSSKGGAS